MRQIVKQGQRFSRREVSDEQAREELAGEPYKLELIGIKGGAAAPDAGAPTAPSEVSVEEAVEVGGSQLTIYDNLDPATGQEMLEGPVPRAARAHHPADPGVQADALQRRVLAGQREEPAAAADLRHRLGVPGGAGRVPEAARRGGAPRPPAAGRRAGPVLVPDRDRLRAAGLPPQGRDHPPRDGGLRTPPPRGSGLPVRQHPAPHQGRAVPDLRAPRLLRREHVPAHGTGRRPVLHEADELPDARADLLLARAVLPGAAAPAVRVRHRVPVREVRCRARPDPGPRLHPGRLAHLLHPGAAGPRAGLAAGLRGRPAPGLRADGVRGRAVHPAGEVRRGARGVGRGRGGAAGRPGRLGPAVHGRRG